ATALCFYNHLVWSARALGVLVVSQVVHKTLFAPLIITVATNAAFAAVTAGVLTHLLIRLGQIKKKRGGAPIAPPWAHPPGLLMAGLISLALAPRPSGLAPFLPLPGIVPP